MYSSTTHDIRVTVQPVYLDEQSSPEDGQYVWAYQVRIENLGAVTMRLRNRYWSITDARGRTQEVRGPGVVGEQPILRPGDSFEYTSGCPLPTPSGMMVGSYEMEAEDGERIEVAIPAFSLDSPHQPISLH
ncbi:Co2+/Mg2+ efflux protein ApaG [Thalassobaculum sp.]|jgi:ApaG protein|uniref:Co2+/Mg2+ efflux protein ApaG n=1 Tax=Thalassobaculum sp. TaxID=2022740 RepID=UPI0032EF0211